MDVKGLKHAVLATCVIAAAGVATSAAAVPPSPAAAAAFEQGRREDATRIGDTTGVTPQAALARLQIEAALAEPIAQLRTTYRDRLAGVYIEHAPAPRVVVRLTGTTPAAARFLDAGVAVVPVDFVTGAAHTQGELRTLIDARLPALKQALPGLQGSFTDARSGEVVLDVVGDSARSAALQARAGTLLGVPVRLRVLPAPLLPQVRGSGRIDGGNCTGAFVVQRTGTTTTGLLSAGHCPNTNSSYADVNGTAAALTYQAESYNASNDAQWYTTSTPNQPMFYASSTALRTLTGRRTQASTAVGNNVCHYGSTTGYSCGDVIATDYQPTAYTCNGQTCAATYIALGPPATGTGLACAGGDSGGPWFISTVAAGIHSAGASSGTGIGSCQLAIYTSTDRISTLGLQLLYGP